VLGGTSNPVGEDQLNQSLDQVGIETVVADLISTAQHHIQTGRVEWQAGGTLIFSPCYNSLPHNDLLAKYELLVGHQRIAGVMSHG
jgi:hypothetical protein